MNAIQRCRPVGLPSYRNTAPMSALSGTTRRRAGRVHHRYQYTVPGILATIGPGAAVQQAWGPLASPRLQRAQPRFMGPGRFPGMDAAWGGEPACKR